MPEATLRPTDYRQIWERKPALRAIYIDMYTRMASFARSGRTLEIGGGSGNFKRFASHVVSSDIIPAAWLDLVCDAQALPFQSACFANIAMVDVLHHIERPVRFFREAERVLAPGGRVILCEPSMTPGSWPFYKWLHPEPVDMSAPPLADGPVTPGRDPYDGNQAIPTLLFRSKGGRRRFADLFPGLRIANVLSLSLWAYPLSGGFRPWSLLPSPLARPLLAVEDAVMPILGPLGAFRLLVVLEKSGPA